MDRRSPFPGLDPYLEAHWGDVHQRLIIYASDALQGRLPDDLVARVEERVYVEHGEVRRRTIVPDVHLAETPTHGGGGVAVASEIELAESVVYSLEPVEVTESYLEIREATGGRVVTVLEILSPANKVKGRGRETYRKKQREIVRSNTSLVEIDLLRTGRRVLAAPANVLPAEWHGDGVVCVRKPWERERVELHRLPLRKRLPGVPIPLRRSDPPAILDLQAIHDQCWTNGRYDRVDYRQPPQLPLEDDDARWAADMIARSSEAAADHCSSASINS